MLEQIIETIDTPGVYIMIMVFGLVLVPYYLKSIHSHVTRPQEYYMVSFEKTLLIGFTLIVGLILFGLSNLLRFMPT